MAKFFQLAPPDLTGLGLGTATFESMQALGFSADSSLLLVKISFTDDGEPTLLSKYATFVYDLADEKYIANLNYVLGPSANVTQIRDAYIVGNRASWEVVANVDILNSNAQVLKSYSSNGAIIHNLITAEATDLAHLRSSSEIEVENFQLTDDGRYLAVQTSSNLLAIDASDDVNQSSDIYLIDRENGSVSRVSFQGGIGKDDAVYLADITLQGSQVKVAFVTDQYFSIKDRNSIDVDLNSSIESRNDLYLASADIGLDGTLSAFTFELLSVDGDGFATGFVNKDSDSLPQITERGVYFSSDAFSLISGDNNESTDVFISTDTGIQRIHLSGIPELISGADFVGASESGGTIFIKTSSAELLGPPNIDQFVKVSLTDLNYEVVSNNNVQADNIVINGSVSPRGGSYAFTSLASNLVSMDQTLGAEYDLYLFMGADENSAPVFSSGATGSVSENSAISTVIYDGTATDQDAGDTLTYSVSGTDADIVEIDATSGAVILKASADYETQDSYAITVEVSDGTLTASKAVTVSVTDINDAPVFSSGATGSVSENSAISTVIYDGAASDQDAGDTLTYSVSGTDADLVEIDATSGEVTLKSSANYESKASYSFVVSATDSVGAITDLSVTVSVIDVNDPVVGDLSLIGEPLVGEYLEVSASSLSDEDGTQSIKYVWYRVTEIIEGASESRYLVTSADVDSILSVDVIHTDEAGNEDALKIASLLPAYEGSKTYGTESSDKLYSTSENEIFYGLEGEDQFIFDNATQVHGSDKIVDFTKGEDEVILNGYQIGEVVKTLDADGYDLFKFPNQDGGKNQLVIENEPTQNETLKIDHSQLTINFNKDVSVASNEDGDIEIDTSTSFNAVSLEGVTSFKTQIRTEGQSRASDPINLSDVLAQLKHIIGLKELKWYAKYAADTNNDGNVNLSDVLENLKHIIGLKTIDTFDLVSENGQQLNMLDENSIGNMTLVINGDADQSHAQWHFV